MSVYLVCIKGEDKGQFYSTREEAERQAKYLNNIPNGLTYVVENVDLK